MAVVENDSDRFVADALMQEAGHEVAFIRITSGLGVGCYYVTITVTDTLAGIATTNEHAIRVDVLYKSFEIRINDEGSGCVVPQPMYLLKLTSEPIKDA